MRSQTGSSGMGPVGAVLLTVVILAVFRMFGVDLIGYLDAAADWVAGVLTDLVNALDQENR
jgi:hypothetical protein